MAQEHEFLPEGTLCEENSLWRTTRSSRVSTPATGNFRLSNVQFSRNHRPIPIEGATYYVRPGNRGSRTPIRIGKDLSAAVAALLYLVRPSPRPLGSTSSAVDRNRTRLLIGYRTAVNLFVQSCKKTYFDEIRRDDMLDYLSFLRKCVSPKTARWFGASTVFNYFLKTMVFLNDRGIAKYVAKEDWVQKKDWPINVDKRNKNKKYARYLEEEVAAMLQVANGTEEALIRFLLGTGFRIGETAVAEWMDVDWEDKTISVRFKPNFGFKPKDYEERSIVVSDTLLACLKKYRGSATEDALIFPSPTTGTVDKHLDRVIHCVIEKANQASYAVKKPKKPCHAFRVLYATRRHQNGVDIETLRQELGHSDISTTQIYLRSANRKSDKHRARINEADKFPLPLAGGLFLRHKAS
jgi:integrase